MSYNTKEIWIPVDEISDSIATGANHEEALTTGGGATTRGVIYGVRFRAAAADAQCTALPVQIFEGGASGTGNLLYSVTVSCATANNGTNVDDLDMLEDPIPFFSQPRVKIGNVQADVTTTTYSVKLLVKAMA